MNLEIKDFMKEDNEFFLECSKEFYRSDAVTKPVPTRFFQRTFDECLKGSPFTQGMIFWADGERAGYALLSFTYSNEVGGLAVLLEEAYVLPEFQGKRIGGRFFQMVEEYYVVSGRAKRVRLEVTKENTKAIALYERLGYKKLEYIQMIKDFVD